MLRKSLVTMGAIVILIPALYLLYTAAGYLPLTAGNWMQAGSGDFNIVFFFSLLIAVVLLTSSAMLLQATWEGLGKWHKTFSVMRWPLAGLICMPIGFYLSLLISGGGEYLSSAIPVIVLTAIGPVVFWIVFPIRRWRKATRVTV